MIDFRGVQYLLLDLDQVFYRYWSGVPEAFSHYTGVCAAEMAAEKNGVLSVPTAVGLALESYRETSRTTAFASRYGLDEVELYRRHHRRMLDEMIYPVWDREMPHDPALPGLLREVKKRGIGVGVLTHGTTAWAEEITALCGAWPMIDHISGVDDLDLSLKSQGRGVFDKFISRHGIKAAPGGIVMVDDSPANLIAPHAMGMQTVLIKTDRVNVRGDEPHITHQEASLASTCAALIRQRPMRRHRALELKTFG